MAVRVCVQMCISKCECVIRYRFNPRHLFSFTCSDFFSIHFRAFVRSFARPACYCVSRYVVYYCKDERRRRKKKKGGIKFHPRCENPIQKIVRRKLCDRELNEKIKAGAFEKCESCAHKLNEFSITKEHRIIFRCTAFAQNYRYKWQPCRESQPTSKKKKQNQTSMASE